MLDKKKYLKPILLFFLTILIGLAVFQKDININGDNAAYISYAKSISNGDGFRLASHPKKLKSDQYPLLFPSFLAIFIKLFGYNLILLKVLMLVIFAISVILFLFIAKKILYGKYISVALIFMLTNFWLLDNSSIVMSELTFMLFLLVGFYLLLKYEQFESDHLLIAASILFTLSIFVRTIGIAAFFTLLLYLIFKKKYRILISVLVMFIIFYFLNRLFMQPKNNYLIDIFLVNPYNHGMGFIGFTGFFSRIAENIYFYMGNVIQMTLFSFMSELNVVDKTAWIIFSALFAILLFTYPVKSLKKSPANLFLRIFILLYLAILFIWPKVWSGSRFIVPIIPFLYLMTIQNLSYLIKKFLKPTYREKTEQIILVVSVIWALMNFGAAYKKTHEPLTEDWADYFKIASWAKENIDKDGICCARKPFLFYLKSDRECVPIPFNNSMSASWNYLVENRVKYVIIDNFRWSSSTRIYLVPLVKNAPDKFVLIARKGSAEIYRLN